MRQVKFKPRATKAIEAVCDFIESKNISGSSSKWYTGLVQFVITRAQTKNLKFPLCTYARFAALGYSCFIFKKHWIVVFKYSKQKLVVYRLVHGSRLK